MKIETTNIHFHFKDKKVDLTIPWVDINKMTAYKADLITTDCVCLEIEHSTGTLILNEEIEGWDLFKCEMGKQFSEIDENWFMDIALPAFETKETIIFNKKEK